MANSKVVTLLAAAQRTATATGAAVGTGKALKPITQDAEGFNRQMQVFLNCTAAAAGTLDLTIEGSIDGGVTFFTLAPASAWTQVTTTPGKQCRRYEGPIPALIRAVGTAATSPDHTYSVTALLGA